MARGVNKVFIIGNIGQDPESRSTPTGKTVVTFSLGVSEKYRDKETTEWVRCVAWEKLGEIVARYGTKGAQVCVIGKLQTRKWQDKQGATRSTTEVLVSEFVLLGRKPEAQAAGSAVVDAVNAPLPDLPDEDLPF